MAAKTFPKYPNRTRVLRRRFLTQALLLFGVAAAIFFYVSIHRGEPDDAPGTLQRLGESLTPAAPPPAPARPSPEATPGKYPESAGLSQNATPLPEQAEAPPEALRFPLAALTLPSNPDPFAGQELTVVIAKLANRYAGVLPAAWGEAMPGITSRLFDAQTDGAPKVLALTLDACGGKKDASYDAELIEFLRARQIPATLFVTSIWIRTNTDVFLELAADPLFEIACHGARHKPCSVNGKSVYGIEGTVSVADLLQEVEVNARDIARRSGKRPRWFRSGTAYYDDVAVRVIADLGMGIAGYSIAGDEGASLSATRVAAKVRAARPGDVILCHMNKPQSGTREGLKRALPELERQGFRFVQLSELYAPAAEDVGR